MFDLFTYMTFPLTDQIPLSKTIFNIVNNRIQLGVILNHLCKFKVLERVQILKRNQQVCSIMMPDLSTSHPKRHKQRMSSKNRRNHI
jgi:hypothetical protein